MSVACSVMPISFDSVLTKASVDSIGLRNNIKADLTTAARMLHVVAVGRSISQRTGSKHTVLFVQCTQGRGWPQPSFYPVHSTPLFVIHLHWLPLMEQSFLDALTAASTYASPLIFTSSHVFTMTPLPFRANGPAQLASFCRENRKRSPQFSYWFIFLKESHDW